MLQKIRDHLQGLIAMLVLGAIALVFVSWGANSQVVSFGMGDSYAAKVGGEKIPLESARQAWTQQQARFAQQFGGEIPDAFKKQLQGQLMDELVRGTAISQHATQQGYRVSDAQAQDAIRAVPAFQVEGKYDPNVAVGLLAQNGVRIDEFEREIRLDLLRRQLQRGIQASDFVTPVELERLHALEDDQREVRYLTLAADKYAAGISIDDAAIQAYAAKNQARFMTPETVRLAYAELRLDQIAAHTSLADADVRQAYEKSRARYGQGERRRARHILIPEAKDAEAKAKQVLEEVRKPGADFAALAKKYSGDAGSVGQGGELGWEERGNLVKPFEDALFAMKVGEIRGPIKTQFGYHIIELEEIQPPHTRTFEEVRGEIESQLRNDRATDELGNIQEQIQNKLEASNPDFDALVKEFNLKSGEVASFTREAGGAPLGDNAELRELVFSAPVLDEKRIGGPIGLGEDRLVLVKVLEHHKPVARALSEIREQITTALRKERGVEAARKAADEARTKLLSGSSFEEVAKSLGVSAEPARFVGRRDPSTPAPIRTAAFEVPARNAQPAYRSVSLEDGGAALLAVTGSRLDPAASAGDQAKQRREEAAVRSGSGDVAAYVAELKRTTKISINPKAFE